MNGPQRLQIQRGYTGPAPTIGAAPKSSPEPTPARYQATKAAKLARDRYTVSQKPQRPRSRGQAIREAEAMGERLPGRSGGGTGVAAPAADWWMNPWLWAAALGVYWMTRKGKK